MRRLFFYAGAQARWPAQSKDPAHTQRQADMESRKALPANSELSDWRARCLTAAGFALREAYEVASNDGVDLHQLLELIDRGCPPALAVRITAPLEESQACCDSTSAISESRSSRQAEQPSR
jgi:hypothetical protein